MGANIQLGKLVQVPLRDVWKHEALNFTQWLAAPENIQHLGEAIDVEFIESQTEVRVGQFYVDILAKDQNDRQIVIENQLEPSNHDHLGKVITYAAGFDAAVVVWIVESAREEHEQAVHWLNENTTENANFFLLQIEAWKIGDSLPAPRFNIIARPNGWARVVKQTATTGAVSELKLQQQAFYELVRDDGMTRSRHVKSWPKASPQHWYDLAIGSSQAHLSLTVNSVQKRAGCDLYINDNKPLYAELYAQRAEIEAELGLTLDWQELPDRKACRIIVYRPGNFLDDDQASELVTWLVNTADNMARVFPRYL